MLARLALAVHRHRRRTVLAWVAALVAAIALSPLVAGDYEADFGSSGSGSAKATELLQSHFRDRSGDQVTVVWKAERAQAPAIEQRAASTGNELPVPAATLALVLLAVGRGLGLEKLADDDAVDDAVAELVASLVP